MFQQRGQHERKQNPGNREVTELRNELNQKRVQLENLQSVVQESKGIIAGLRAQLGTRHQQLEIEFPTLQNVEKMLKRIRSRAVKLFQKFSRNELLSRHTFSLSLDFADEIKRFIKSISELKIRSYK